MINKFYKLVYVTASPETDEGEKDFFEIAYVMEGSAVHIVENQKIPISAGDYFVLERNIVHRYASLSRDFKIVRCLFKGEFLEKSLQNVQKFSDFAFSYLIRFQYRIINDFSIFTVYRDKNEQMRRIFETLYANFKWAGFGFIELTRCYILEIIIHLFQKQIDRSTNANYEKYICRIHDYVEVYFAEKITLSHICDIMHYSLPYISKKFKTITGQTFTQYLMRVRIQESIKYLLESEKKIPEIAELVGFSDLKHFYSSFKKITGCTPLQYKRKNIKTGIII